MLEPILGIFFGTEICLPDRDFVRDDLPIVAVKPQLHRPELIEKLHKNSEHSIEVFVKLKQERNGQVVEKISKEKPRQGIYLKGKLPFRHFLYMEDGNASEKKTIYEVTYNMENPFVTDLMVTEEGTKGFYYEVYNGCGLFIGTVYRK